MPHIRFHAWNTNKTLFEGEFKSPRAGLEAAISQNINLDYISLDHLDLEAANLDGAIMNHARLNYCNLRGANLSECELTRSQWTGCELSGACFMDSQLLHAIFRQCKMKDVDVRFADLRGLMVTCHDFLKTEFVKGTYLDGAVFLAYGTAYAMSRPPVFVRGLPVEIILLDDHVLLGDTMVLRHDQLNIARHCMIDLAKNSETPPEEMLQTLWTALRQHNLDNKEDGMRVA